mgnify:CR=1 FL=1
MSEPMNRLLKNNSIPSVEKMILEKTSEKHIEKYGRKIFIYAAREVQKKLYENLSRKNIKILNIEQLLNNELKKFDFKKKEIINATGIIIHTNLGRVPLSKESIQAMSSINTSYSDLEYDLINGKRGNRNALLNKYISLLTNAESGFAVNNNATAIMLAIASLASKGEVIISRGELVEIGGGFRIPEIIKASGAKLIEVGTTNKTYLKDYKEAITKKTKAILRIHYSNFSISGFTESANNKELSLLAKENNIPLIEDLGSGSLIDTKKFNLPHEPLVQSSIKNGVDIITFSGDKLLGGPQAGIIVGKNKYIRKIIKHPMARANRLDKSTLIGLIATLNHYLKNEAIDKIPIWQMIALKPAKLSKRVDKWLSELKQINKVIKKQKEHSKIGGGAMPEATLPTYVLSIKILNISPEIIQKDLRLLALPIITRVSSDQVFIDPRTIPEEKDQYLIKNILNIANKYI